ncbi:hypothetical protein ACH4F6_05805 [Streptomyces sp. NPDC017936]|uniref:hypothetical protein n=1 Tax=Streptomyces sp. NPDC017936 TaxID=3365016 RepID=UPI0037A151AF
MVQMPLFYDNYFVPRGYAFVAVDPPADTPTLTLDLSRTSVRVPLAGGAKAFADATAGRGASASPASAHPDGVRAPRNPYRIP